MEFELRTGALGASIKVGEFNSLKDRMALRIEQSRDDGRELIGIFVRITGTKGESPVDHRAPGPVSGAARESRYVILRLTDGQIIQDEPKDQPARAGLFPA